jgi:hypothetical protein
MRTDEAMNEGMRGNLMALNRLLDEADAMPADKRSHG